MSKETKLGLFVLVATFFLILSIVMLGNFNFRGGYYLNIVFDDISGIPNKSNVKVAGVEVGAVKKISLENGKALVKVWLDKRVQVHDDAEASVASTGLIGSKYIALNPGSPSRPVLKAGDTIVGITPVSLDQAVQQVMKKIDSLVGSFESPSGRGIGENLGATVDNLRQVSEVLRDALANQEERIRDIIANVDNFTGDVAEITADNKENIKRTIEEVRSASEKLNRVLAKIDRGEGTIGALMSDEKMGNDLKQTFEDVRETAKEARRVMKRINYIETQWDYRLRYDYKYDVRRHDVGLRILPRPDKYYYLGGSNLGENEPGAVVRDPETLNTFNALVGKRFGAVELYAGLIRSKGGVGIKLRPFKWNPLSRLEVTAEGYNFFREAPVRRPRINMGGNFKVANWAFVGAQFEDLYYSTSLNAYMNLVFRDDDIGYILGLVGLARP